MAGHTVIVNCTPVGMFPKVDFCPDIPYELLTPNHLLYDLLYNPNETLFMKKAKRREPSPRTDLKCCCCKPLPHGKFGTSNMKKILKYSFIGLAALCTALLCGGYYMLGHALNPDELITRSRNSQASYEYMFGQYPELKPWVDSLQTAGALRDFYIKNDRGETLHALYVAAAEPTRKTAVIVHGYTDNSIRMLNIGYLYNRQLKYNILLPDLHGHGASEGAEIQMGWLDRLDVLQWTATADELFGRNNETVTAGDSTRTRSSGTEW